MEGLTIGAIVHYVLPAGRSMGQHRAALVVNIWDPTTGAVDLAVFTDGSQDGQPYNQPVALFTGVVYSATMENGTWHWLETWPGPFPPEPPAGG
jgi:hypothetical protein